MKKKDFEKFYFQNIDKVFRFVYFRCRDKELTEDLVSEIFMKVMEHFEDYDETKSKTAWLMTIAKNHLANHWRDTKKTQSLDAKMEEDDEDSKADYLWFSKAVAVWRKEADKAYVYEILAKLSPEEAELVTFHYLLGYSYSEVAEMKDATEGAVKVATHRALKKMKQFI